MKDDSSKIKIDNSSVCSNEILSYATNSSFWYGETLNNLANVDDEELKRKISKKISEILDEDTTIQIMKDYLLEFIDRNIDNPETLIKEVLVKRDEELNKCKEEIEQLKKELNNLKILIPSYINLNPYPLYPTSYPTSFPPIYNDGTSDINSISYNTSCSSYITI